MSSYTICTRTRRSGIAFRPQELRPLGIQGGTNAWGVWVRGGKPPAKKHWLEVQAPHLVVSPLHPNLWPTAFTIRVLMERRTVPHGAVLSDPTQWDAMYGLSDALARCGASILFVQTAQVGYDLIACTATCELVSMRAATAALLQKCDSVLTSDAHKDVKELERATLLCTLGMQLLPRLADLEAQLTLIDGTRREYAMLAQQSGPKGEAEATGYRLDYNTDVFFRLLTGMTVEESIRRGSQQDFEFERALKVSSFFNAKCVEAGENMYYMDYGDIGSTAALRSSRRGQRGSDGKDALPISSEPETAPEIDELPVLYDRVRELLCSSSKCTPIRPPMREWATAQRVGRYKSAEEYEIAAMSDLIRHQAYVPIRISPLTALAHARFWAYTRPETAMIPKEAMSIDSRCIDLIPFAFQAGLLRPQILGSPKGRVSASASENWMEDAYKFLKHQTQCESDDQSNGEFETDSAVFATVDAHDRFLRLRFVRRKEELRSYLTLRVLHNMRVLADDDELARHFPAGVSSQGLLNEVIGFMLSKGLRAEVVHNELSDSRVDDAQFLENGTLTVIFSAFVSSHDTLNKPHDTDEATIWNNADIETGPEPAGVALLELLSNDSQVWIHEKVTTCWLDQFKHRITKSNPTLGKMLTSNSSRDSSDTGTKGSQEVVESRSLALQLHFDISLGFAPEY